MTSYIPPVAYSFRVVIGGGTRTGSTNPGGAHFSEVSGLDSEVALNDVEEGGENRFVHRLPTGQRSPNLVLKRGVLAANSDLAVWCKDVLNGSLATPVKPHDVSIILVDQNGKGMMSWTASGAWPVKWQVGSLDSTTGELAMETLELAFRRLTRNSTQRPTRNPR